MGTDITFSVVATGTAPLSYQWQYNGINLTGAIGSSLTITNAQMTASGSYTVQVSNAAGFAISASAMLTVNLPSTQPVLRFSLSGNNLRFSWPMNFILQTTTGLSSSANWSNVTALPIISNNQNTIQFDMSTGNRFFRLIAP